MSLLSVKNLTIRFGGLVAVNDVSFDLEPGTITGLIGPNGAGKTTVFNLITGNYRPTQGQIIFEGRSLVGMKPHRIVSLGIARTFQTIRLFQTLSVLENVLAGRHCRMTAGTLSCLFHAPWERAGEKKAIDRSMRELEFVGLAEQYDWTSSSLSYGNQRLLEIARALATDPKLIVLDEPAGGMNDQETAQLIGTINAIRDRGITVLLIEHDMNLVMKVCEYLVVLEYGAKIADGPPELVSKDPVVIEAYLGVDED